MKVFISVDMEGVAGVSDWDHCERDKLDYGMGRELMTGEANAAIEGALAAGATDIVVADSHGKMFNLFPEKLHPAARVMQGKARPLSMMQGIERGPYAALALIGYHGKAITKGGILAHTYSGGIRSVTMNGIVIGEIGLNALLAEYYGTPLVFVAGDAAAANEAQKLIPGIGTVATKEGFGKKASLSMHPSKSRELIRAGVEKAMKAKAPARPKKWPASPFKMEIVMMKEEMLDLCQMIPGMKRVNDDTIVFEHADYLTVYGAFLCTMRLGYLAAQE